MSGPFQVGDVVVCVKRPDRGGNRIYRHTGKSSLHRGKVYSIRKCFVHAGIDGVLLNEIEPAGNCVGFPADRFRHLPKADEQFTQQMRALRPLREEQSA